MTSFNVPNMSFNAIRENKILGKISESTVFGNPKDRFSHIRAHTVPLKHQRSII